MDEIDFRNEDGGPVKRLVWSTDLHFDAADRSQYLLYFDLIRSIEPDFILIGGDISNGVNSLGHLTNLTKLIAAPCFFVLGNHDYYYGSIEAIRNEAKMLTEKFSSVQYLTGRGIIALSEQTALIGHDGWGDAGAGDYFKSEIMLNDYLLIEELKHLNSDERFAKLQELGKEAADYLKKELLEVVKNYERVIILTHVPPFEESCLYEGVAAEGNWTPHFVCKASGVAIKEVMKNNPEKQLLILCGHSHWRQDVQILPNLRVVTGHSTLGIPNVQGLILIN